MSDQGTRYNKGKLRWRNVPMWLFKPVVEVGQFGEEKYDTFNFLKCFPVNDTLDSLKRHLEQFENPYVSDLDAESLKSHMAHVAWNALVILHTLEKHPEMDDRYRADSKPANPTTKPLTKEELVELEELELADIKLTAEDIEFFNKTPIKILTDGTFMFIKNRHKITEENIIPTDLQIKKRKLWERQQVNLINAKVAEVEKIRKENSEGYDTSEFIRLPGIKIEEAKGLDKNRFLDFSKDKK